jgi:hypothetical protein
MSQTDNNNQPTTAASLVRGDQKVEGMPFFLKGKVIKGFGRGSKQLGIPTGTPHFSSDRADVCIQRICQ